MDALNESVLGRRTVIDDVSDLLLAHPVLRDEAGLEAHLTFAA
jgi:hypothetical protein